MNSPDLLSRIEGAKRAVSAQTELLHREFGRAESKWKSDGTRVTAVDVAISENIFASSAPSFPRTSSSARNWPRPTRRFP
jgi:myo-inositol-1(or 4)-monophosphatase